jgi:hypothetical protein
MGVVYEAEDMRLGRARGGEIPSCADGAGFPTD